MALPLRNWNSRNSNSKGAAALLFLLAGGISLLWLLSRYAPVAVSQQAAVSEIEIPKPPVTLLFVGDVMLDRGVRGKVNKYFASDYNALFQHTGYVADADIAFANLEGPVAVESTKRTGSKFSFRMDPGALPALRATGFDIVSFANNHVGDYSLAAFRETLQHLDEVGIAYAGAGENYTEAASPTIIDVRGTKIGYLASTDVGPDWLAAKDDRPGILLASDPRIVEVITEAKSQVDVLVYSVHWSNEYSPVSARQETLAKAAIDAGADIVVGHHPHVMQKFEYYKDKPIFYSLGNFIFDQYFSEHTLRGMVGEVSIDPQTKALTMSAQVSPQDKNFIPQSLIPFDESLLLTKSFTP